MHPDVARTAKHEEEVRPKMRSASIVPLFALFACSSATVRPSSFDPAPELVQEFRGACERRDAAACDMLGQLYASGLGVPLDRQRAEGLFLGACHDGYSPACSRLARVIAEKDANRDPE
jgi:hypothetical protein